jgi:integrase
VRGLAFTGCPKGEANQITWRDVDFDAGEIVVRVGPETVTKNWTVRRVPLIPNAQALFERMHNERPNEPLIHRFLVISHLFYGNGRAKFPKSNGGQNDWLSRHSQGDSYATSGTAAVRIVNANHKIM